MDASCVIAVLFDAASSLQSFVSVFVGIYILLIFVFVILSWIDLPYSRTAAGVQQFLNDICRPYLNLFRGRIPMLGPLDLSPMVAVVVLIIAMLVVNGVIGAVL
jgi:YggT family protein